MWLFSPILAPLKPLAGAARLAGAHTVNHRPRFQRAKQSWRPTLALQERDVDLLRTIESYRLLSSPQLQLLFADESERGLYRRLHALYHHGYLDRLKGEPNAPIVYALAARGAEILVEHGHLKEVPVFTKKNAELQRRYVAHQAMIADFRIALELATRAHTGVELVFFHPEGSALHDRVSTGRGTAIPVYPDGFFSLHFPGRPEGRNRAYCFLEADRSTMILRRYVTKLTGYWRWFEQGRHTEKFGIRVFRVLTITRSEERMASLLRATAGADHLEPGRAMFWFTAQGRYPPTRPAALFDPIWETPDAPGQGRSVLPAELVPGAPPGAGETRVP